MFALPRHPHAPSYQSYYNPYERLLLEQELERQRRAEAYRHRQLEIEQLNRRRQYEYARRQAELQRPRQLEMGMERQARRMAIAERAREHRRSVLSGMEDLFDILYGGRVMSTPPRPSSFGEDEVSQEPPVRSQRIDTAIGDVRDVTAYPKTCIDQVSIIQVPITQDTCLSVESTKQTTDTPTALLDELESGNTGTDKTHQLDTAGSHAAVAGILATFASLSSNFTFPSHFDFSSSSSSNSSKPAYTPNNGPLHQYEHELTGLLTRLDAVESYGDEEVRKARKEAVKQIEKELAALDERKIEKWRKQSSPKMELGVAQQTEDEIPTAVVDATNVPLPEDLSDEDGEMDVAECEISTSSLTSTHPPSSHTLTPHEHVQITQMSLGEASSSDDSGSEVEDYVEVEADVVSAIEAEETEETEVGQERDLVGLDKWQMDFWIAQCILCYFVPWSALQCSYCISASVY
ncbi:hypothetical protein FS749_015525 [Ceratobasidium sp. UAMH 11750]|nr:hypothetical protein FS749_015525 [Ceratobasidium sp. UAMH 11750]